MPVLIDYVVSKRKTMKASVRTAALIFALVQMLGTNAYAQAPAYPPILKEAMAEATHADQYQYAYTVTQVTQAGTITATFDPHRASGDQWQLESPDLASLSPELTTAWTKMQATKAPPQEITLSHTIGGLSQVKMVSNDGRTAVFSARQNPSPNFGGHRNTLNSHLVSEITVQVTPPRLIKVTSHLDEAFSIAPFVKVDSVDETVELQYLPSIDAVVVQSVVLDLSGSSILEKAQPNETVTISDISADKIPS